MHTKHKHTQTTNTHTHTHTHRCMTIRECWKKKIWRFGDSAGTKNPKLRGTNKFPPLYSNHRVVQINCCLYQEKSVARFVFIKSPGPSTKDPASPQKSPISQPKEPRFVFIKSPRPSTKALHLRQTARITDHELIMTLHHTASHCNSMQRTATLQHTETHWNTLQHSATHCNTLQDTARHCNTLQLTATHCNTLQHTATHCNTLRHTATHTSCNRQEAILCCMQQTHLESWYARY